MEFVGGAINRQFLKGYNNEATSRCSEVIAAVPYADNSSELFDLYRKSGIKLTYYARYDASVPVPSVLLEEFIKARSPNFVCRLVPDILHAKIIWWVDYGAYIGSANLTNRGWYGNIEAGVFVSEASAEWNKTKTELERFFYVVAAHSYPLTDEYLAEIKSRERAISKLQADIAKSNDKHDEYDRKIPKNRPLTFVDEREIDERRKQEFLREWNATLQTLRDISDQVSRDYRPAWMPEVTPAGIQADQFLHAFYYRAVRIGNESHHETFYARNAGNPAAALRQELEWWRASDPSRNNLSSETTVINEWAPWLSEHLANEALKRWNDEDFVGYAKRVHAARDHAGRVPNVELGIVSKGATDWDVRIDKFGRYLTQLRNRRGERLPEVLQYLLYGGPPADIATRLWECDNNQELTIPHIGVSTLGETIGWALPNQFPPRNQRTSKALRALGYDVRVY